MIRSKITKGFILTSSILLVITFLGYRAGLFPAFTDPNTSLQTSPNGSTIQSNSIGKAAKPQDSITRRRMLSSSKSMVIADWKNAPPANSGKKKLKQGVLLTEQQVMSSSKSAIIIKKAPMPAYQYKDYKKNTDTSILK